ncbi:hypothetical protein PM082_021994 [Marasmius tenuissimus]|nr:hypothetical protein PM082_021994 [Marasmius tenuissimus]
MRVLSILLRKRTRIHRYPINSGILNEAYATVTCILLGLTKGTIEIDTPTGVKEVVEARILQSLYYAADCFYDLSEVHNDNPDFVFVKLAASVLDQIVVFIPFHSVLRPLVRSTMGFWSSHEDGLPGQINESVRLKEAWNNLLDQADDFYELRWALKHEGLCDYAKPERKRTLTFSIYAAWVAR